MIEPAEVKNRIADSTVARHENEGISLTSTGKAHGCKLEAETMAPDFGRINKSPAGFAGTKPFRQEIQTVETLEKQLTDHGELLELALLEDDPEVVAEVAQGVKELATTVDQLELRTL